MKAQDRYDSLFIYYGERAQVSWTLLKAQGLVESGLNPDAKSKVGAFGLAQFMPATFAELAVKRGWLSANTLIDPRDPEDAIRAQSLYMAWLLKETGSVELALAAYNWGIGRVKRIFLDHGLTWSIASFKAPIETQIYVAKVLKEWKILEK